MNIDELCAAVNRRLRTEKIKVDSGRTAARITPRNVRYYRTIGVISPPARKDGRADYSETHVREIVAIKRGQSEGRSLAQVGRLRAPVLDPASFRRARENALELPLSFSVHSVDTSLHLDAVQALASHVPGLDGAGDRKRDVGWSVRVGDITVSGAGEPPTEGQVDRIMQILRGADPE